EGLLTERARTTGRHAVCNDLGELVPNDLFFELGDYEGHCSAVSLPLEVDSQCVGTFNLHAGELGFFDSEELRLLDELAQDIAFALTVSARERQRKEALSQLQVSEERFRELAETIQEVFWVTDPTGDKAIYVSPAYEKIWGRPRQTVYDSPHSWADAIHPDDRQRVKRALRPPVGQEYDEEYRVVRPNGEVRWILDQGFPVVDSQGKLQRYVGVARDITERKSAQEQLRQAQKLEAVGQLAGGVAHDFNNVLVVIMLEAQLAEAQAGVSEEVRRGLREIRLAAERAASLSRQLLLFSSRQVMQPCDLD